MNPSLSYAQLPDNCEEIALRTSIKELQITEITSLICDDKVYISINELFNFIRVKNVFLDSESSLMEGFFSKTENTYTIDEKSNLIIYKDKRFDLNPDDLISTTNNLYIRLPILDKVFNFKSEFFYRDLTIVMQSAIELPAMKEARILERRLNIAQITNTIFTGDSIIRRRRPLRDFGTFTYSLNTRQQTDGVYANRLQLGAGGQLFGGDFESAANISTEAPVTLRNLNNTFTYVDNQQKFFKQFRIGNVGTQSVTTLFNQLIGFQITNRSTQLRNTFENYVISDYTEPFWTVELYVNNVLIDYTQADATGLYTFNVPIVYGRTDVRLRFFGQFGEEKTEQQLINVPFNFLPKGEFEYQATAGVLIGDQGQMFSQFRGNYGVNRWLTLGIGNEYLKTAEESSPFIYTNASVKVRNNLTFSTQYAYKTQFKASLNYFTSSYFNFQLNYSELSRSQTVVRTGSLREIRAIISTPIRSKYIGGTGRVRYERRSNGDGISTSNTRFIYSGKVFGLNSNLNLDVFSNSNSKTVYRARALSTFNIYRNFLTTPEILYNLSTNRIDFARLRIRKEILKRGFLDFNYTRSFFSNTDEFSLGLRYDFDFARTGAILAVSDAFTSFSQNITGGIEYSSYDDSFSFNKNATLGRANLKIVPYLDKNENGKRDFNEEKVAGITANINKGRISKDLPDGSVIFKSLESYIEYYVELRTANVENIAYKLTKDSYNVVLSPNKTKVLEVPVIVTGEVAGYVYRKRASDFQPFSRIKVNILDENFKTVATVLSEFDGYFSYLGLKNGNYTARLDNVQLQKIFYNTSNPVIEFTIDNTKGGEILDNLEFYLEKRDVEYDLYDNIIKNINF